MCFPPSHLELFFHKKKFFFFLACSDSEDTAASAYYFSEEAQDEMLKSDPEDMECDARSNINASAASDSFHSTTSPSDVTVGGPNLLKISGAYRAIQAARRADMSARHLANNTVTPLAPQNNLLTSQDLRSNCCFHVNSYEKKRNITAYFDTGTLRCSSCTIKPGHPVLEKSSSKWRSNYNCPAVFILADQSFPASLPTGGAGECLHILVLKDGSLADLTDIFLDTLKPFCVPAGSVVLLHSLSHLAWVGPAAYTEDLVRARQRICGTYRTGILVLHGLPLPLGGCSDPNIANDLQAVADWLILAKDQSERDISTTSLLWRSRIIVNCSVPPNNCTPGVQPPATPSSVTGPVSCPPPVQPPLSNVQPPATFFSSAVWPPASAEKASPSG